MENKDRILLYSRDSSRSLSDIVFKTIPKSSVSAQLKHRYNCTNYPDYDLNHNGRLITGTFCKRCLIEKCIFSDLKKLKCHAAGRLF